MEEPKIDDLTLLEHSCNMFLLRYLLHNPGQTRSSLMAAGNRCLSTKQRRIGELHVAGLIEIFEGPDDGRFKGTICLTPTGKVVAEHLDAIYEAMKPHLEGCNSDFTEYINPEIDKIMGEYREKHPEGDTDRCDCE